MENAPQFVVVFVSQRSEEDPEGYRAMSDRMETLARQQAGFAGIHSVRDERGKGITVSYWTCMSAIRQWAVDVEHLNAQRLGRERWYQGFEITVAKVERQTEFGTSVDIVE